MDFAQRLYNAKKAAGMTVSELAIWFERSQATTGSWLGGGGPRAIWLDEAEKRLAKLEFAAKQGCVIPYNTPWKDRAPAVRKLRDEVLFGSDIAE